MARKRGTAEQTKAAILAVAVPMLRAGGPAGIRLDEVAAEVGISRQAVLHHFGSRAGLMRAVVRDAWTQLFDELMRLSEALEGLSPEAFFEQVDVTARQRGHARVGAWLLLSDEGLPDAVFQARLEDLPAKVSQGQASSVDPRDSRFAVLAIAASTFGDAIFGGRFRQLLNIEDSEQGRLEFRQWLASRLWPSSESGF